MLGTRKVIAFSFVFVLGTAIASAQCMNQECCFNHSWNCYQCCAAQGFACSVPGQQKCATSCTNTWCGGLAALRGDSKCRGILEATARFDVAGYQIANVQVGQAISLSLIPQPNAPAMLEQTTHSNDDLLIGGLIRNNGEKKITAFRIAFFVVHDAGDRGIELKPGSLKQFRAPLAPRVGDDIGPQRVSSTYIERGARRIAFFVAEVHFEDGSIWLSDVEELKSKVSSQSGTAPKA